jgi:pimeloyl-ACP methyl ester carboxylesterase
MPVVNAAGRALNYEWAGDQRTGAEHGAPTLIFLHEGLGSIRQWRDFPARVAAATGCRTLVYDRYGYGDSQVLEEARRPLRFMHDEALAALPELRDALGIKDCILVGHSDGASIALIHAGAGHAARGVAVMAPHVFIEPVCITSIEKAKRAFETTDLPVRLGRYHRDARRTFYGWADVWTEEAFTRWDVREEYLRHIRCPVLAIQGHDDEYGTMTQLDEIARHVRGPCELVKLADCGHAPFRDQPEATLAAVTQFVEGLK